jgi:cell division protease FtsH
LIFADVSTGAADDLRCATHIVRNMVVRFGMTTKLGQVAYEPETGSFLVGQTPVWRPKNFSGGTAEAIDTAVRTLIDHAFRTARAILERHRPLLETEAMELMAKETLGPAALQLLDENLDSRITVPVPGASPA